MVPLHSICEVRAVSAHCSAISRQCWPASAYRDTTLTRPATASVNTLAEAFGIELAIKFVHKVFYPFSAVLAHGKPIAASPDGNCD